MTIRSNLKFTRLLMMSVLLGAFSAIKEAIRHHSRTYLSRFRYDGVQFAPGSNADSFCQFEGLNRIWNGSVLSYVYMGRHTYCGVNCRISQCSIGRFCSIGPGVVIGTGTHPTDNVSTFPGFYSAIKHTVNFISNPGLIEYRPITIGNDVWIGHHATILDGVTIGDGAIIGAGAVVSKDVPPYAIVGGIPARLIRFRFSEDIIKKLCDLKWWNWTDELIQDRADDFKSPHLLLRNCCDFKNIMSFTNIPI